MLMERHVQSKDRVCALHMVLIQGQIPDWESLVYRLLTEVSYMMDEPVAAVLQEGVSSAGLHALLTTF